MLHEPRHLEKVDAENLDQRLRRIARENSYAFSVIQQGDLRRYHIKRDEKEIAELETLPTNGTRLELRSARLAEEKTRDFFDILNAELRSAYQIDAAIGQGTELAMYRALSSAENMQCNNPEDEAKRQAIVAELRRGLPTIAPTEPPTVQAQPLGATPNVERKYRTARDSVERVVRDFTCKWLGDSAQRAPFADVRVELIGQAQIEIEGQCESPKGLENAFEYLPMVKLTPTIINADSLKVKAWAMNWTENPDAKKTVDNFLASLIRELDHYLGDAPSVTTPTMQAQTSFQDSPIEIFFSYAQEDKDLRGELAKRLSLLKRQGVIADWYDRKITAGTEWKKQIDEHLNSANIILLLISPDFINSDYCYDIEMKRALERHENGTARVIPIILRSCDWQDAPFGKLQALPKGGKPVTSWTNRDEAFTDIAEAIKRVVREMHAKP